MGSGFSKKKKKEPAPEPAQAQAPAANLKETDKGSSSKGKAPNSKAQQPPAKDPKKVSDKGADSSPLPKPGTGAGSKTEDPAFTYFLNAYKASPGDGWKVLSKGDTVSVLQNGKTGSVLFPTTMVKCEFQCPVPAVEAAKFLTDLGERHERDYFFSSGKVVGGDKEKRILEVSVKSLDSSEQRSLKVSQLQKSDERGNIIIVEKPEGSDQGSCMLPSWWIQSIGDSESSVVALYRFDIKKVWKEKANKDDTTLGKELQDRFKEYASPIALALLMLGTQKEVERETSRPAPYTPPPPPKAERVEAPKHTTPPDRPPAIAAPSPGLTPSKDGGGKGELVQGGLFNWKKGELIGHGAIGKVYMGLNFDSGEMMAVKVVDLGQQLGAHASEELKAMDQEIHIFKMISHPNLVRYYGMDKTPDQLCIFLEYVSGGSIASMLRKFGAFSEQMMANFTAQIVDGLHYLHSQAICHRDIKAANILYSNEGIVKLADFGTAKKIADVMNMSTGLKSLVGTPYMMAPEVIRQTGHGMPADIWSLACVIWEMATTKPPFTQFTDRIVAMYNIAHAKAPPEPPETLSPAGKEFVKKCMIIEAKFRAKTIELLEHPWVANVPRKAQLPSGTPGMLTPVPSQADKWDDRSMGAIVEEDEDPLNNSRKFSNGPETPVSAQKPGHSRSKSRSSPDKEDDTPPRSASKPNRSRSSEEFESPQRQPRSKSSERTPEPKHRHQSPGESRHTPSETRHRKNSPPEGKPRKNRKPMLERQDSDDFEFDKNKFSSESDDDGFESRKPTRSPGKGVPDPFGSHNEELSEDGYTKQQCQALGRPFYPAKKKKGALPSKWGNEERSDSEPDSDEDTMDQPKTRIMKGKDGASKGKPSPAKARFTTSEEVSDSDEESD